MQSQLASDTWQQMEQMRGLPAELAQLPSLAVLPGDCCSAGSFTPGSVLLRPLQKFKVDQRVDEPAAASERLPVMAFPQDHVARFVVSIQIPSRRGLH